MALTPEQVTRLSEIAADFARMGDSGQLGEFLDHGFDVNTVDPDGNSLLMLAAYHGHDETVRLLIKHGADLDLVNHRGQAPLAGALFKGEDAVVRTLVVNGAGVDVGSPSPRSTAEFFGRLHLLATPADSTLDEG